MASESDSASNLYCKDEDLSTQTPIQNRYTFWYHRRGKQVSNYEEGMTQLASFQTVEHFWRIYNHMVRPNDIKTTTDYHLFKNGVTPTWEDPMNKDGGKWMVRLKKGLTSRLWEELVLAIIGEQFDVGQEICGAVLSVRHNEDIISVWNKTADNNEATAKIRDQIRRILKIPNFIPIEYKTHNDSLNDKSSFRNPNVVHKVTTNSRTIPNSTDGATPGSYTGGGGYNNRGNYNNRGYNPRYANQPTEGGSAAPASTTTGWKSAPNNMQANSFSPNAQLQPHGVGATTHTTQHSAWGKRAPLTVDSNTVGSTATPSAISPAAPAPAPTSTHSSSAWATKHHHTNSSAGPSSSESAGWKGNPTNSTTTSGSGPTGNAWGRKTGKEESAPAPSQDAAAPATNVWARKKSE